MLCPSDDDLSSYLAGHVRGAEAVAIEQHVASCRMCEVLVEVLGSKAPLASAPTVEASGARPGNGHDPHGGDSVGGYVLQQKVGAGGMGVVWEAYDPELDRPVALKLMRDAAAHLRARFDQEVRITARLQHPSIVNIFEAGTWHGEPYYVMKLVRGESLDRKLAARAQLAERLALLPNVIAVVDAIAYAHGARVIHRDLKPENVLVGEFGEAVVIDWGLAKSLVASRGSAPELAAGSGTDGTVAGSVIGTPAYMPPEQARGEAVDARADVYALGAILYFLLAGERPYADAKSDVVAAVVAGPPAALRADVPAELATIVARAMARDAAERYATAKELAEDLKRFQTGQLVASHRYTARQLIARWVRRHRGAVAVGGIALAVLATLSVVGIQRILDEKQRATEHQLRAEEQRAEVEKLLTFMLVDLRTQLVPFGKVALLEKIAQQAEAYFDGPRAGEGDPHVRFEALVALGELRETKGHGDVSLRQYRAAQLLARSYAVAAPHDHRWWSGIAEMDRHIGMQLVNRADLPGGLDRLREGVSLADQVVTERPSAEHTKLACGLHDSLGSALAYKGDISGALAEYRRVLASYEELARAAPADTGTQREIAVTHSKIADLLGVRGEIEAAIAEERAAVALMQNLVDAAPLATAHVRDLAIYRGRLGGLLAQHGEHDAAVAEDRAGVELLRRASQREPDDEQVRGYLASALLFLSGDIEATRPDEAVELAREAQAIRVQQVAADPTNVDLQQHLLGAEQGLAESLKHAQSFDEALVHARAAVSIGAKLIAQDPTNREREGLLIGCYSSLGEILAHQDKREEAIAAQREGLAIAERLSASDPKRTDWLGDVADRHISIGEVIALSNPNAAKPEYRAALAILDKLVIAEPSNPEWPQLAAELRTRLK